MCPAENFMWSASSSLGARNDSALVFDALCSLSAGRIQPTPADRTSKAMSPDVEEGKDEGPTKSAASLPPHSTSASRLVRHQRTKRCCMFLLTVFCGLLILSAPQHTRYGCAPCTSVPVSAERLYPYRRYGAEACTMVHRAPPVPRYSCTVICVYRRYQKYSCTVICVYLQYA